MKTRWKYISGIWIVIASVLFGSVGFAMPPERVRVTSLTDFLFGSWSGIGGLSLNDNICAHRSTNGTYNITASGDVGGAFLLTNTIVPGQLLGYQVYWNDQATTAGRVQLTANVIETGFNPQNVNQTCQGGSSLNANLSIDIPENNLLDVAAGTYTGTLTLIMGLD